MWKRRFVDELPSPSVRASTERAICFARAIAECGYEGRSATRARFSYVGRTAGKVGVLDFGVLDFGVLP